MSATGISKALHLEHLNLHSKELLASLVELVTQPGETRVIVLEGETGVGRRYAMESACWLAGVPWVPFEVEDIRDLPAWAERQQERHGNKAAKVAIDLVTKLVFLKFPALFKLTQQGGAEAALGLEGEAAVHKAQSVMDELRNRVPGPPSRDMMERLEELLAGLTPADDRIVLHVGNPSALDLPARRGLVALARANKNVTLVFSSSAGSADPAAGARDHEARRFEIRHLDLAGVEAAADVWGAPAGFFNLLTIHTQGHRGPLAHKLLALMDAQLMAPRPVGGFLYTADGGLENSRLAEHFSRNLHEEIWEFLDRRKAEGRPEFELFFTTAALCEDRFPVMPMLAGCRVDESMRDEFLDEIDEFLEGMLFEDEGYDSEDFGKGQLVYRWDNRIAVTVLASRLTGEEKEARAESFLQELLVLRPVSTSWPFRILCQRLAELAGRDQLAAQLQFELDWVRAGERIKAELRKALDEKSVDPIKLVRPLGRLSAEHMPQVVVAIMRPLGERPDLFPVGSDDFSPKQFTLDFAWALYYGGELAQALDISNTEIRRAARIKDRHWEWRFRWCRAEVFVELCQYFAAEQEGVWLVAKARDDEELWLAKALLGSVYMERSIHDLAEMQLWESERVCRKLYKSETFEIAGVRQRIGILYLSMGRGKEAEVMLSESLKVSELVLGRKHLRTAMILHSLGQAYLVQGRYTEAEANFSRALELEELFLGPQHLRTLITGRALGEVCTRVGKYPEAEKRLEKVLEAYTALLGADHLETARTRQALGTLYWDQGKTAEAEEMLEEALAAK